MRRAENAACHADALGSSHGVPVLAKKIEQIVREIKGYLFGEEARGRGETLF